MYRSCLVLLIAATATAAGARPRERLVTGDGVITIRINGVAIRLRVDPASPSIPVLDRAAASRVGLTARDDGGRGPTFYYGALSLPTSAGDAVVDFGDKGIRRRVAWLDDSRSGDADGSIGPGGLPEPVVRFQLRAPRPGERTLSFPAVREQDADDRRNRSESIYARMVAGGETIRIRLEPYKPRTLVSAGAGTRLARLHGGVISGRAEATTIQFSAQRPVRTLALRSPAIVGPFALARLGIRVADYGSAARIAEADTPPEVIEPNTVVVTARRRRDPRDLISIGSDQLVRCSSIVFDRRARRIGLTCA